MFLDTVNNLLLDVPGAHKTTARHIAATPSYAQWLDAPFTSVHHHGKTCCEMAREWLFAMDFSLLNGESLLMGPRWIRRRYEWGPAKHPIHWCEAVKEKTLDCGVLAAFAHECFIQRGVTSYRIQLVQRYSEADTGHWEEKWDAKKACTHWLNKDLIYHEGCAVLVNDKQIKLWDASAGWWIDPSQINGYGSLAALKIFSGDEQSKSVLQWGPHHLLSNTWQEFSSFH